jgi:hypothetical protein
LLTNLNGNKQPGGNRKKGHGNNHKGGRNNNNNNNNKPKENANNDRSNKNVVEGKKEKRKVKFPCKLCTNDHLTHLCPKLEEATRLLSQPPVVMTNQFLHNQYMASSSSNSKNVASGNQNPPTHEGDRICVNMVKYQITKTPLHIKNPEPQPRIPKGVLKLSSYNPNTRVSHNYLIVEDLGQTPCAMSALELLQTCPS